MEVINQAEWSKVCGGDMSTILGYAALTGLVSLIVGMELYLIHYEREKYNQIDFSKLTPKQAYDLGVANSYMYCRHF